MDEEIPKIVRKSRYTRANRARNVDRDAVKRKIEFLARLSELTPRIWVTPAIIGLNALVFCVMAGSGVSIIDPTVEGLLDFGADYGPYTANGQWWRLLTSTFIHIGIFHLLINMWVLALVGPVVERLFGNWAYLYLYLLCGLAGSLASISMHPDIISAGASGAIFGVFGALLAFALKHRDRIPARLFRPVATVCFIVFNLLAGFFLPGIDNAAHIGGLAIGLAGGLLLFRGMGPELQYPRAVIIRGAALGILILGSTPFLLMRVKDTPAMLLPSDVDEITALNENRDFERLIEFTTRTIAADPNNPDLHNTRGWARYNLDDLEGAREDFEKACQLDPSDPYAQYGLGLVCLDERDAERAYSHFARAAELDPADPDYVTAKIRAAYQADRYQDLYADCKTALAMDPDNANVYYIRGLALGDQGDLNGAINDQTQVIRINPDFDRAWAWRGYARYAKGEWVAALGDFKKAFRLDSEEGAELVLYIWAARSRIGEKSLAMQDLERVLKDKPFTGENQWIPMVGEYLAGRMSEEDLADALGAEETGLDKNVAVRVRCFHAGTKNLLNGRGKTALSRFKRIVDEDLQSSELWAAREEIKRLEAEGWNEP